MLRDHLQQGKYNALPKELQAILKYSAEAASADMSWKLQKRYPEDLVKIEKQGVKVTRRRQSVLEAQLAAWDKVLARLSADKFFEKVVASQKAWAKTIVGYRAQSTNRRATCLESLPRNQKGRSSNGSILATDKAIASSDGGVAGRGFFLR